MRRPMLLPLLLFLALVSGLTACGNRGPLYLPDEPQSASATGSAESTDQGEEDEEDEKRGDDGTWDEGDG